MPSKLIYNGVYGSITMEDGTDVTPLTITVDAAQANFSLSNLGDGTLNEETPINVRGKFLGLAPGDRIFPEVSFEVLQIDVLSHATQKTAAAFVLGMDPFSDRVSTLGEDHFRFTCDVTFEIVTSGGTETIELTDVALKVDSFSESDEASSWSITGTVYGTVSVNGVVVAQEIQIPAAWTA